MRRISILLISGLWFPLLTMGIGFAAAAEGAPASPQGLQAHQKTERQEPRQTVGGDERSFNRQMERERTAFEQRMRQERQTFMNSLTGKTPQERAKLIREFNAKQRQEKQRFNRQRQQKRKAFQQEERKEAKGLKAHRRQERHEFQRGQEGQGFHVQHPSMGGGPKR